MTMGVSQEYEARRCEEYQARREENFNALRHVRTEDERRAIEYLITEDCAAHFRLSEEDRQYLHDAAGVQRWMLKWARPLIVFLFVFPVVLEIVFTGKRRAWAWSGLVLAVGFAATLVAYLTGSLPM